MEPYFEEHFLTETMVILPKFLDTNLFEHLRIMLTAKYPKTYLNKGYIFNIKIISVLDNKITLSGQIILKIKFRADLYVPKIGHIFEGEIKKGLANKFQWIEIGPLTIFLNDKTDDLVENVVKMVQITNIKVDNTLCFGKIIN